MEKMFVELYNATCRLRVKGSRITDIEIFKYRDQLVAIKNRVAETMDTNQEAALAYADKFLSNAIELTSAIKEMRTPQGNDKDSIKTQRKLLNWFENEGQAVERKFRPFLNW